MIEDQNLLLSLEDRFRRNDPSVVSDIIDGEAIVMNMATGHYYSLTGSAAEMWRLVTEGFVLADIAAALESHYRIPKMRAEADIRDLVTRLRAEQLIVATTAGPHGEKLAFAGAGSAYEAPELAVYSDMTNLLALDPPMPQYQADSKK